jgi:hypothetical protein
MKKVNLQEYIHPRMDILFVALNAPEISNSNAHWFSATLNFWNILFDAGLITERIENALKGDKTIFGSQSKNYNKKIYGVTDLVRNIVQTNSSGVKTHNEHVQRILSILDANPTNRVCLMHSTVADQFQKSGVIKRNYSLRENKYGLVGKYNQTEIYEVPFHNAMIKRDVKLKAYGQLIGKTHTEENLKSEPKKEAKATTPEVISSLKGKSSFYLPEAGNSITQGDIEKATLRITVGGKIYFSRQARDIGVVIKGRIFKATYTLREGRSDLLRIGRPAMEVLGLKAGGRVKVTRMDNLNFAIEIV